jgi:hypothetical protein
MNILAFDTGKVTGVGAWKDGVVWSDNMTRDATEDFMYWKIREADIVICEKLVISQGTIRKSREIQPAIEMVGLARALARWGGAEFVEQMPAEVMGFATDEKLKRIGWYVAGPDHQRDARRHLLTLLANRRMVDLGSLLYGKEDDAGG